MLRLAPVLTLVLFLVPIVAGLVGTTLPAFGIFPALGRSTASLQPWFDLFATPGLPSALRLTLSVGLGATLVSVVLAAGFCAIAVDRPRIRRLEHALAPLLATPHVAAAIGFAFLISPSGWIARALSPELTGWSQPPDLVTTRDPYGVSFLLGLVLKETPFLVLMMIAASGQVATGRAMAAARSMGYVGPIAWLKAILPQIYPQIRLPIYAVLAFSLSVVDVGLVLAPGQPPPLSILAARWFAGYELALYLPAAAAAVLQLVLVAGGIGLWRLGEIAVAWLGRRWIARGHRYGSLLMIVVAAGWGSVVTGVAGYASLLSLGIWSFAQVWRFPDAWPSEWTLMNWARLGAVWEPLLTTLAVGMGASLAAVLLALACLENEQRRRVRPGPNVLWLLYLPLLVPQIAFLFGAQVLLVRLGLDGTFAAVIWAHLLFVLPYVFLALADPYRSLDPRYARIAAGLGTTPWRVFWRVKAPLLLRPVLVAFAIGFAVSVGQYLPTLFAGAGRVVTLTTEVVTLAGGADRRLIGVAALVLSGLPLLVYGAALAVPALVYRHRTGLR